jgi:hypothetical protein
MFATDDEQIHSGIGSWPMKSGNIRDEMPVHEQKEAIYPTIVATINPPGFDFFLRQVVVFQNLLECKIFEGVTLVAGGYTIGYFLRNYPVD